MQLYDYQHAGVNHLLSMPFGKPHALLADAPGTGKTVMAIEAARQANCKTGIILCPAIAKEQWRKMALRWGLCAEDEIGIVYGQNAKVSSQPWQIINYDIVRLKPIREQFAARNWHALIEDEAHKLKAYDSLQTKAIYHKDYGIANQCYWKWPMSGSMMPNRPLELYPVLKTHFPEVIRPYDNYQAYMNRYCGGAAAQGKGATNIPELTERIQSVLLRRELRDVWGQCPDVIENDVWLDVPFDKHPEWIGSDFMYESTERRVVAEAKAPQVVEYVKDRLQQGVAKIVVFAFTRKVIEDVALGLQRYGVVKIYGGMSPATRQAAVTSFQTDSHVRVILIQIISGGEALDGLQEVCNECIEAEPEWSPGREDQAIRRLLRLGQRQSHIILTRLLASNSYEEVIYSSNRRKQRVIDVVMKPNGGNFVMSLETDVKNIAKDIAELKAAVLAHLSPAAMLTVPNAAPAAAPALPVPAATVPTMPPSVSVPVPTAAPSAPPAVPQSFAPPAPPAPLAPPPVAAKSPARAAFEEKLGQLLVTVQEAVAEQVLLSKLGAFQVQRVGDLQEGHFDVFLQHIQHGLTNPSA